MRKAKMIQAVVMIAILVISLVAAFPARAGYCDQSQNGCDTAGSHTECYGHGAFGAFGDKGDGPHDFGHVYPGDSNGKPGANGQLTGDNNSNLCGSPANP